MTETRERRRALVVGLGIAGIATAVRLRQAGWEPVLVERAPERRSSGYFILLFGTGIKSARRLGVLDEIGDRAHPRLVQNDVNRSGRRSLGANPADIPVPTKPRRVLRGDVERGLFAALPTDVDIRYSTAPVRITQGEKAAEVTLRHTDTGDTVTERFNLVVGADGIRSTVRELAFGPKAYLYPLNYMIGITLLDSPVEGFGPYEGLTLAEPGRSAWTMPFADHPPSLLFSYRTKDVSAEFARPPIESIRSAFGPRAPGPLLENLFQRFEQAPRSLFDSAEQVRMPQWHNGRVVLVGDAAWCMTLYTGMGASSALAGADLLGAMLERHNDVPAALRDWDARMRPFVDIEQKGALTMRRIFTPRDRRDQLARLAMIRLLNKPALSRAVGRIMGGGPDFSNKELDVAAV